MTELEKINAEFEKQHKLETQDNYNNIVKERNNSYATYLANLEKVNKEIDESQKVQKKINNIDTSSLEKLGYPTGNEVNYLKELRKEQEAYTSQMEKIKSIPIDNIVEPKPTYYEELQQAEAKYLSQMEAIRTSSIDKIKSSEQSLSGYLKQESDGQIALNIASQDNNTIRKQKIGIIEEENGQMVFNVSNQEKEISATEAQIVATNALVEAKNKELLANTKEKLLSMNTPGVSKNEDLTVKMLQKISKESDGASKALADLTLKEIGLGEGATKASIGMKALAMAGNMLTMLAISEVLSLVVKGFDALIHRVDNAKDALEEFNSSVKEQKDNLSTQESWINENGKRFEELSQGVDEFGHNVSLTTDEFSEYKDMTSKIAEMFPTMIKGYNDQNDVILKNKGSVDELTEAYKKNQEAYYADIRSKSSDTFNDFKTAISDDSKNAKLINNIINGKLKLQGTKGSVMSIDGSPVDTVDLVNALGKDTFDKILKDKSVKDSLKINTDALVDFDSLTPELQQAIRDAFTSCNATMETESEKVKPILDAYFDTNTSGFKDLSEEAQTDAKLFASNVTGEFLDQFDSDVDMEKWVRKNVISPLKDGIDSDDLGGMTANLLGGKTEDESIGDYEKRISTAISDIKAYCKKNKIEIPFNLDAIKSEADEVKATAKSVVKDIEKDVIKNGSGSASDVDTITNWVNSLTQDELKYAQSDEFKKALVAKQQELGRTSLAASEYKDVLESVKKTESDTADALGGTLDSVKKAFESNNASTDWTSLAGYLKQAKELYDGGFIGTDDFQSVAQWMSPDKIDTSQYEISANAYVDAWKNAYDKVSRWFDSEDETASIWNFLEDLKTADSSLVDIDKDAGKVQTHFSSTAEVAKALGVNVEVVETMLKTMSDYGFQLDGVEDSAQELEQIKTDLASVQALYDNMQDGSRKDRLGELLKNWNAQVDGFQQDMSTMQQGFDIPIKFEYDIQQIYDQIDQIRSKMANGGKESRNDYANLLGLNDQAISKLEDHTGTDDITNEYLEKYQNAIEKKSKAISKAVKDGDNDEDIIAAQKELDKKQQEYEKLLQQFNDWGTKNNIDFDNASAEDFQNYWNDFFSQPHELEIDAKVKNKKDVENLLEDASGNSTITFTANVDGVEQQITAIKNEDGTITYYGDVSDPETQVYYVKDQDGMIYFSGDTTEAVNNVIQTQQNVENSSSSFTVGADTSPAENSANSLLAAISQGKASVTVDGNLSPFQKAWNSVAGFLNKLGGNVPTFSTTHNGGGHSIGGSSGKISGNSRTSVLANKERALNTQMRGGSFKKNTSPSYVNSNKKNTGAGNLKGNLTSPSSKKSDKSSGKSGKSGSGGSGGKNSGGDAEKQNEEYLDKFMAYQKALLEAGKITYQQYSQYVSDELERMYKNGKISASKYYSAVKDMIDEQKSIYDAALKGVTKLLDDEIDKWKDKIDVIEKNNDKLNEQKDKYDSILSAIQKVYDDEIKKANKKKDSIQDVIDAMSDENDEYERQKKLQEAIYNLNKANSQKTKYLLKDGQFVYSTDNSAIRDAQDSLHDAQYDVDVANLKKQQDDIDNYIDTLNEFKDKWNEISDAFSEAQDAMNLKQYLGSEYQRIILSNNLADIENFKNQYVAVESQINSNEQLKTSYEEKVDYYNNLKQQWEDCTSKYDDEKNKLYASQILGANWEAEVLSGRQQTLANFTSEYEKLCQRQADATVNAYNTEVQAAKNAAAGIASVSSSVASSGGGSSSGGSSGGSSSSTHKVTYDKNNNPNKPALKSNDYWTYEKLSKKGYSTSGQASSHISDYASKGANGFTQIGNKYFIVKWIANAGTPANASKAKNKLEKDNPKKIGKYGYAKRYHKGLELGKIEALPKDKAFDLVQDVGTNGLEADEVPIIAQKGEAVLTEEQIENLAKTLHLVPVQNEIMEKMNKISLGNLPMNTPKMNFDASKVGQNVTRNNFAPSVTLNLNCPNVSSVSDAKAITNVVDKQLNKFANDFYQASLHYINKK